MNFNENSIRLTKSLTKNEKRTKGVYFTPMSIVVPLFYKSFKVLSSQFKNIKLSVLEPSCGSGQFLNIMKQHDLDVDAVECDKRFCKFNECKYGNFSIIHKDFLKYKPNKKYHLIIGNPPYFKYKIDHSFKRLYHGVPNIYVLFITQFYPFSAM